MFDNTCSDLFSSGTEAEAADGQSKHVLYFGT